LEFVVLRGERTAKAQSTGRDICRCNWRRRFPFTALRGGWITSPLTSSATPVVSALGNNTVEVIDTFAGRVIRSIKGLSQPQGPLYVPGFDKLYVANAENGKVNVYDGATYTLKKTIDFGVDPDNVRYDSASKKVFVGFGEEDGGIAMIDPATDERVGQVYKTEGHPESFPGGSLR